MQGSLGYFILPIVNVAIGTSSSTNECRRRNGFPLFFAIVGVIVLILWLGLFPWIALTLAFSFSIYGVSQACAGRGNGRFDGGDVDAGADRPRLSSVSGNLEVGCVFGMAMATNTLVVSERR